MAFLMQLNAPLDSNLNDRILLLWFCKQKSCQKSSKAYRALRSTRVYIADEKINKYPEAPLPNLGDLVFGNRTQATSNSNPFAMKSENSLPPESLLQLETAFTESLKIEQSASPPTTTLSPHPLTENAVSYSSRYLALDEEKLTTNNSIQKLPPRLQKGETSAAEKQWSDEAYEVVEYDKLFDSFSVRIGEHPSQCIRYIKSGKPIFYSNKDVEGRILFDNKGELKPDILPPCSQCHAKRSIEVQVLPQTAVTLEGDNLDLESEFGIDWGIISIATCTADCHGDSQNDENGFHAEEFVLVQMSL